MNIDAIHYKQEIRELRNEIEDLKRLALMVDQGEGGEFVTYKEAYESVSHTLKSRSSRVSECTACSGSGYYDSDGSPKCGACGGTGKESSE